MYLCEKCRKKRKKSQDWDTWETTEPSLFLICDICAVAAPCRNDRSESETLIDYEAHWDDGGSDGDGGGDVD